MTTIAIVAVGLGVAGWPAHAEDSGFWETVRTRANQNFAPAPSWFPQPAFRSVAPTIRRAGRPKPQIVRLPEQPVMPSKPADPSKRENPLVTLLSDPTLRKGDIVMFPDGPRVFRGTSGTRHAMADFVDVSRAKDISKSTRKALAALPVGENNAWISGAGARGQLAQNALDVETTGSLSKRRSRR